MAFRCKAETLLSRFTKSAPSIRALANAGPGSKGNQFFITHVPAPWLDGKHTVFGEVTEGRGVVHAIRQGDKITAIEIIDSPNEVLESGKDNVARWNKALK